MTTSSRSRELEGVSAAALRTLLQILCCVFLFLTVLMVEMLIGSDRIGCLNAGSKAVFLGLLQGAGRWGRKEREVRQSDASKAEKRKFAFGVGVSGFADRLHWLRSLL